MDSTPHTAKQTSKGHKFSYIRRRIISPGPEGSNDLSSTLNKDLRSSTHTEDVTQDDTMSSDRRYNLRDSQRLDKETSQFYKSVLTPSRVKKKTNLGPQKFRTPHIPSTKRKEYIVNTNQKVPIIVRNKWKEDCEKILKRNWKFCYLSSINGFHYNRKNLRISYERLLKNRILNVFPSYKLTVDISTSSFLRQQPQKTDSIFITVTSFVGGEEDEEDRMDTVYECLLIKVDETQSLDLDNIEWFPLCLFSGRNTIHSAVIAWLQSSFGCYVSPKGIIPISTMLFFSAIWTHGSCSDKTHKRKEDIVLRYIVHPPSPTLLDPPNEGQKITLKVKCKAKALNSIWSRIQQVKDESLNFVEVSKFHNSVQNFVEAITLLPKSFLHLAEVQTSCMVLSTAGRLRMTCKKSFLDILNQLLEIFMLSFIFNNSQGFDKDLNEDKTPPNFEDDEEEE